MFFCFLPDYEIQQISHCYNTTPMSKTYPGHFHTNCEILLVINGNIHYNIDGEHYVLNPYDLVLIPPSAYHFLIPMSNTPYESYVLNFSWELLDSNTRELFSKPTIFNVSSDLLLHRMFGLFDSYYAIYNRTNFAKSSGYLLREILLYIRHAIPKPLKITPPTDSNPLVMKIVGYITAHIQHNINSDVIARELNFSKSYLQNIFSATMDIGLQQYINQKKILAAHYDIQNGVSLNDVAAKYGYRNYSSFYRQYKNFFGHSPKVGKSK